jgi:acyl-CoA synthetase (AMP-forming)/AMP-acid ligase II
VQSAPTPPPPTNLERVRKRLPSKQALFDLGDVVQIVDYSKDLYSESFRIRSVHWNEVSDRWFYTGDLGTFSEASLKLYQRGGQPAVGASE